MSGTREENLFMARLAEQAERFEDMAEYMERVAKMGDELTLDERNLLSIAYKNSVGSRRQAVRMARASEEKEGPISGPEVAELIKGYRNKMEQELHSRCADILAVLGRDLVPRASAGEPQVFYMKMKGDYYRYQAEFSSGELHTKAAQEAAEAYQAATQVAQQTLPPEHQIRLGLALNYSVFFNEVMGDPKQACNLAKAAFDDAQPAIATLEDGEARDSVQIMQLLRDNLSLWMSGATRPGDGNDGTAVEDL